MRSLRGSLGKPLWRLVSNECGCMLGLSKPCLLCLILLKSLADASRFLKLVAWFESNIYRGNSWPCVLTADKKLSGSGLERTEALQRDIEYMQKHWGLKAHTPAQDGPGHTYARWAM